MVLVHYTETHSGHGRDTEGMGKHVDLRHCFIRTFREGQTLRCCVFKHCDLGGRRKSFEIRTRSSKGRWETTCPDVGSSRPGRHDVLSPGYVYWPGPWYYCLVKTFCYSGRLTRSSRWWLHRSPLLTLFSRHLSTVTSKELGPLKSRWRFT